MRHLQVHMSPVLVVPAFPAFPACRAFHTINTAAGCATTTKLSWIPCSSSVLFVAKRTFIHIHKISRRLACSRFAASLPVPTFLRVFLASCAYLSITNTRMLYFCHYIARDEGRLEDEDCLGSPESPDHSHCRSITHKTPRDVPCTFSTRLAR